MKVGGKQCIRTLDGYIIPLDIINGLPYLPMEKHTDEEWETLPHVIMTGPGSWDPRVLDNVLSEQDDWANTIHDLDEGLLQTPFDEFGNYKGRTSTPEVPPEPTVRDSDSVSSASSDDAPDDLDSDSDASSVDSIRVNSHDVSDFRKAFKEASDLNCRYLAHDSETVATADETDVSDDEESVRVTGPVDCKGKPFDYDTLRPYFLHAPKEKIQHTFKNTTQYAANIVSGHCWTPISSEISSFPTLPVHYPRAQNDHLINRTTTLQAEQQKAHFIEDN